MQGVVGHGADFGFAFTHNGCHCRMWSEKSFLKMTVASVWWWIKREQEQKMKQV
jgi:hypothetical protein